MNNRDVFLAYMVTAHAWRSGRYAGAQFALALEEITLDEYYRSCRDTDDLFAIMRMTVAREADLI